MPSKDSLTKNTNCLSQSGLSGQTVTGLSVYQHGVTIVLEVGYSGGPSYLKVRQGQVEFGGTNEWGTGTKVLL
jgi:hypothetical protein